MKSAVHSQQRTIPSMIKLKELVEKVEVSRGIRGKKKERGEGYADVYI